MMPTHPMSTAPTDGTMLRLLVKYNHAASDSHPLEDSAEPSWTIGMNNFDNDGFNIWLLAGWDWEQDCFTQSSGEPIGWAPFLE